MIFSFKEVTAGLLVLLFLYTALTKLKNSSGFIGAMQHNPLLYPYANLLSWLIPIIELIIVALLFIPGTRRSGILASAVLLSGFTGYIGYMLFSNSQLPCTCGGVLEHMSWRQHLVFNTIMTVISIAAWLRHPKRFVATNRSSRIPV